MFSISISGKLFSTSTDYNLLTELSITCTEIIIMVMHQNKCVSRRLLHYVSMF